MLNEKYNNALCREKHKQIDEDINEIKETLKEMNCKLDNKFVTRNEVKTSIGIASFVTTVIGFCIGHFSIK